MKSIVLEGDFTEAPCEVCQGFTQAQFAYGPIEMENGATVENVMRATCQTCGSVVSLAQQSSYLLRQALSRHKRRRTTVQLPQELADFIALKLSLVGMRPSKVDLFFRDLLLAARGQEHVLGQALSKVEDPSLSQRLGVTVNLSLRPIAQAVVVQLLQHSGLRNASEVLRRLLVLADAEGLEFGPNDTAACLSRLAQALSALPKKENYLRNELGAGHNVKARKNTVTLIWMAAIPGLGILFKLGPESGKPPELAVASILGACPGISMRELKQRWGTPSQSQALRIWGDNRIALINKKGIVVSLQGTIVHFEDGQVAS